MLRQVFASGLTLLVFLIIAVLPSAAQVNYKPVVSSVQSQQRTGTKLVDITYDVDDKDGDMLTISVAVSDNGGSTFTVRARTFIEDSDVWRGSDGLGIAPGMGKKIVWDAGTDVPGTFGTNFRVKVTASDAGMVLIPAGPFLMGDTFNEGSAGELPVHEVYLDDFYMDAYEVTNAQYAEFDPTHTYPTGKGDHPVTSVSWFDAADYAQWAGKRLPTEAEWEKAARGGVVGKRYPWGDSVSAADANYYNNIGDTTPVGDYPPNGYGLYDAAGNVVEWCADWYDKYYYKDSPLYNPQGPDSGAPDYERVLRGGGWGYVAGAMRVASRYKYGPALMYFNIGFRCAGDVIP